MCDRCKTDGIVLKYPGGLTRRDIAEVLRLKKETVQEMMRQHPISPLRSQKVNGRSQYIYSAYEVAEWVNHEVYGDKLRKMLARDKFKRDLALARENNSPNLPELERIAAENRERNEREKRAFLARKARKLKS